MNAAYNDHLFCIPYVHLMICYISPFDNAFFDCPPATEELGGICEDGVKMFLVLTLSILSILYRSIHKNRHFLLKNFKIIKRIICYCNLQLLRKKFVNNLTPLRQAVAFSQHTSLIPDFH